MLLPDQLQELLRKFDQLKGVECVYPSELQADMDPWTCRIQGYITIHGHLRAYETEIDTRQLKDAADLLKLAENLIRSFEDAAKQLKNA
jgi:hypothetical protein